MQHREFKVNQRIKEMELMSKLAEMSLRMSHAELANHQASVWSELNKAHEAASDLLTPAQSQHALSAPNAAFFDDPTQVRRTDSSVSSGSSNSNRCTVVRTRPAQERSMPRLDANQKSSERHVSISVIVIVYR